MSRHGEGRKPVEQEKLEPPTQTRGRDGMVERGNTQSSAPMGRKVDPMSTRSAQSHVAKGYRRKQSPDADS